jgi:hypothetical protein
MYSTLLVFSLFGRGVYVPASLVTNFTRNLQHLPTMAANNQQQQAAVTTAAIRLPGFYADSPQSWFDRLDSTFATANITQSIPKFHGALAKLPFLLIATVRPLSWNPTAVRDPYKELQELLLRSYGLSAEQMTNKWLDYPMCGDTRPSVLWDNLTALQPESI